jgi:hypothetical protein
MPSARRRAALASFKSTARLNSSRI